MIFVMILRHAPTLWNAERRIQGRADRPLSLAGEALAASWRVPDCAGDWPCVSSPLRRAVQTARAMGLTPRPEPGLAEMDWGRFEGRSLAEIRAEGGAAFAAEEAKGLDFRPPGGETPREVGRRAAAVLAGLAQDSVVVTHKGVLRALFALATGWDMRSKSPLRIADGCCHHLRIGPGGVVTIAEANIELAPAPGGAARTGP